MDLTERIAKISPSLVRFRKLHEFAPSAPKLPRSNATNSLVRVHFAHYLPRDIWEGLGAADRHLVKILAVNSLAASPPVFSHESAAVLLGLPLFHGPGDHVHVTLTPGGVTKRSEHLVRHRDRLEAADVQEVSGLRFTTATRTILDLCKTSSLENALGCADAHLRHEFRVNRLIDGQRLKLWRGEWADLIDGRRGQRGTRAMRQVLELADPRIDSVLESVSHLRLRQLGYRVEPQVAVPGPRGVTYYVDFKFRDLPLFGECDGRVKYTDANLLNGASANEVVFREKRRQEWICQSQNSGMIRWGAPEVRSVETFAHMLRSFNVPLPGLLDR